MVKPMPKDPDAVLDFRWDWAAKTNGNGPSDWLDVAGGEVIANHTVTAPAGLTVDSSVAVNGNTAVVAWLSGGTPGQSYKVTCHVVTNQGRQDDRTIPVAVDER